MQRKSPLRPADPGTPPLSQWDVRNFSTLHLDSEPCIIAEPRVEGRIRISFRLQPGLRLSSCVCAKMPDRLHRIGCFSQRSMLSASVTKKGW